MVFCVLLGKLYKCELQSNSPLHTFKSGTSVKRKYVNEYGIQSVKQCKMMSTLFIIVIF